MPTDFEIKKHVVETDHIKLEAANWATIMEAVQYLKTFTNKEPCLLLNYKTYNSILFQLHEHQMPVYGTSFELGKYKIVNELEDDVCLIITNTVRILDPNHTYLISPTRNTWME